jgi:hypothetical protein
LEEEKGGEQRLKPPEEPNDDNLNHTTPLISPATSLSGDSPIKPLCPLCYNDVHCTACKLDASYTQSSNTSGTSSTNTALGKSSSPKQTLTFDPPITPVTKSPHSGHRRSTSTGRPFSVTSQGSTLIGEHENHQQHPHISYLQPQRRSLSVAHRG